MRVGLIAIGRMKDGPERELVSRYLTRAVASGKPLGLTDFAVTELPESRAGSAKARKAEEARAIAAKLREGAALVCLDERGASIDSEAFAQKIAFWRDGGRESAAFVIGGADGLDHELRSRAELVLSFSPLTWPHQMVRMMAAEQLYRATTILSGHPYHRGE
jgi:23S rRNA (pseudouridine1915-N3)-methyltransferase